MPASPVVSFQDTANGGDFTVTVTGSTAGASNQLYAQAVGGSAFATEGSPVVGNGSIAGNLTPGYYWLYVLSSHSGSDAVSNFLGPVAVQRDDEAVYEQILNAVVASLQAMCGTGNALEGISSTNVLRRDDDAAETLDLFNVEMPAVIVRPGGPESVPQVLNTRDDIAYTVTVTLAQSKSDKDADSATLLLWRQAVRRYFIHQRVNVGGLWLCEVSHGAVLDLIEEDFAITFSDLTLQFTVREPRGV